MNKVNFINQIQDECINNSIAHDINLLSSNNLASFNDSPLYDLAQLLQNSDQKTKTTIEKLILFTAKNSIATILHLIDTQFTLTENTNQLNITDFLDIFLLKSDSEKVTR